MGKSEDKMNVQRIILKELKRLRKMRHLLWQSDWNDGKASIPENEWNNLWEYHQSLIDALSYAYNDIVEDELKYNQQTCENKEVMQFPGYFMLEGLKTHYQELNFAFRQEDGDICMDLEDTVQICSSYRPHYHEFSSHFAARFPM